MRRVEFKKIALFSVAILAATPIGAQEQSHSTQPDLSIARVENGLVSAVAIVGQPAERRSITAEMARLHVLGVSVAVLRAGAIAWAKGYGVTRAGGPAVTPDTLFQAGSISKPVTAFAALRLVDRGRLNLDRDVNEQLIGWNVARQSG